MLFQAFTVTSLSCCLFRGVFPLPISSSGGDGLRSGIWLGQSKTFHFFSLMKSFVVLAVCFVALSCYMMNFLPISLDAFLHKLADKVLLTSELILLLPSWIMISEPSPEAAMQAQPWHFLCSASQMFWIMSRSLLSPQSTLWPFNHFVRGQYWCHQSIKLCFTTFVARLSTMYILISPSNSYYWWVVCILYYSSHNVSVINQLNDM